MRGAKRVPKTAISLKMPGVNLAVVRAEINRPAVFVQFIKAVRKQRGAVKRAVKCAALVIRASGDLRAAEHFVPAHLGALADGVKISVADFAGQILFGLFGADKRRSHFAADDMIAARIKLQIGPESLRDGEFSHTRHNRSAKR